MAKLSRVEKHKNQKNYTSDDDLGTNINNDELRAFQSRLNKIDSDNFAAPDENTGRASDYDPIHVRRVEEPAKEEQTEEEDDSIPDDSDFDLHFNEAIRPQDDNEMTNDYLSRYINEVKQYNIDQGNASSGNTSYNILKGLEQKNRKTPDKPYPDERSSRTKTETSTQKQRQARTTEVPFINSRVTPASHRSSDSSESMSVDDIASRVQSMADEEDEGYQQPAAEQTGHMNTDEFTRQLEMERTTNQKLLDQTTQMQARMDDVGENLNDVTNKMRHTNRILNIVLVVVIAALVIVFAILIYWIVLAGGTQ